MNLLRPLAIALVTLPLLSLGVTSQEESKQDPPGKKSVAKDKRIAELEAEARMVEKRLDETSFLAEELARTREKLEGKRLRIAMIGFVDVLELDDLRPATRRYLHTSLRRVWGPDGLGLHGALRSFARLLAQEHDNERACVAVLKAVAHLERWAAPIASAVQKVDARGRPRVLREKRRALRAIAPRGGRLVVESGPPEMSAPPVTARVVRVNPELRYVVLSMGADDEVMKGIRLAVLREGKLIGEVQVDYVYPKACSASFVSLVAGRSFSVGDTVRYEPPVFGTSPKASGEDATRPAPGER